MPDGGFAGNEIIVADAQSNFGLVSLSVKPPTSRVYYARAAPGMKAFGAWAEVSDPALERARDATAMAVASDQSSIIVWTEHVSSLNAVIVVARSADGGTTWQRSNLTAPDGSVAWPNLCASPTSGRVAVVYIDELTGETALRVSDDSGATWPATSFNTVAPQEQIGEFPSCVVNATDLWVMQGQSTETPTAQFAPTLDLIQLSHSADGGKTLDATVSVQDPSAGTRYMRAMATVDAKKRLALAYYAGAMPEDPQASVRYSYSIDSGKTFAPSVSIHSPIILTTSRATKSWLGDLLGITADAHDTFVAFAANGTGASHVGVVRIPVIAP